MRKLWVVLVAVVGLLAGCSGDQTAPASTAPTSQPTPTMTTVEPVTPPPVSETPGLAAAEVLAAFTKAKLPVRNARDNSKVCETQQLGCLELISTDDVTITTWGDAVPMEAYAQAFGSDAFVLRNVVLQYAAARTPAAMRPRYQLALTRLAG